MMTAAAAGCLGGETQNTPQPIELQTVSSSLNNSDINTNSTDFFHTSHDYNTRRLKFFHKKLCLSEAKTSFF